MHPGQQVARTCALVSWMLSTLRFVIFREVSACSTWKEPPPPQQSLAPGQLHVFDAGDGLQDVPGLGADLLPLHQMAGVVVGDPELRCRRPSSSGSHSLCSSMKTVTSLSLPASSSAALISSSVTFSPNCRRSRSRWAILVLERRAAGGAVDDDGIHVLAGEELQGFPDALQRGLPLART